MFIYPIYYHNWRNISTIYIHNKTSIKRNILTIKQITLGIGRAKDLSVPLYSDKLKWISLSTKCGLENNIRGSQNAHKIKQQ